MNSYCKVDARYCVYKNSRWSEVSQLFQARPVFVNIPQMFECEFGLGALFWTLVALRPILQPAEYYMPVNTYCRTSTMDVLTDSSLQMSSFTSLEMLLCQSPKTDWTCKLCIQRYREAKANPQPKQFEVTMERYEPGCHLYHNAVESCLWITAEY